jgi:DNA gyrase subunit A
MRVRDIPVQGRATQGVRVMRVDDGEHIAAIERLAEPADESGEGAPVEEVDEGDTIPNEDLGEEAEDEGDEADDEDVGDDEGEE